MQVCSRIFFKGDTVKSHSTYLLASSSAAALLSPRRSLFGMSRKTLYQTRQCLLPLRVQSAWSIGMIFPVLEKGNVALLATDVLGILFYGARPTPDPSVRVLGTIILINVASEDDTHPFSELSLSARTLLPLACGSGWDGRLSRGFCSVGFL